MSRQLTKEAIANMQETFRTFDKDGNGFIDIEEIETMMKRLNIPYTHETIVQTVKKIDTDGNGYLDFEEFCEFMKIITPSDKNKELRSIFDKLDLDKSGTLEPNEIKEMMKAIGNLTLSDEELQDMMLQIDSNGDGHIQFEEFVAFFQDLL